MMKKLLRPYTGNSAAIQASSHMFAASCGEVVSISVISARGQNLHFSEKNLHVDILGFIYFSKTNDCTRKLSPYI